MVQALGFQMVWFVGGFVDGVVGGIEGVTGPSRLYPYMEIWLLPLSICVGTMGAMVVSIHLAKRRAVPSLDVNGFWALFVKSYDFRNLWRFVLLGVALSLGFVAFVAYGVLPPADLPQPLFDAMISAPLPLQVGWALMFIGLFPVIEEVLFRGFFVCRFGAILGTGIRWSYDHADLCWSAYAKSAGVLASAISCVATRFADGLDTHSDRKSSTGNCSP